MDNKKVGVGVGIMIVIDNKVLLGQRNKTRGKLEDGTWTLPGGKVEFGETLEEAIIRETKEETNLNISKPDFLGVQNDIAYGNHFITIGFITKSYQGNLKTMEPDKIDDWTFFDLNHLPNNIYIPSKKLIEKYQAGVFYKED